MEWYKHGTMYVPILRKYVLGTYTVDTIILLKIFLIKSLNLLIICIILYLQNPDSVIKPPTISTGCKLNCNFGSSDHAKPPR